MSLLTKSKFEELAAKRSHYCISIYIPTEREGDNKKGILTLKNQLTEIKSHLEELGLKSAEISEYVAPIKKLLNDSDLWRHLSDSLCIFRNSTDFNYTTLPIEVSEFSMVSDRYHLLPLLAMFTDNDSFYILTLSQKKNALYKATKNEITEFVTDNLLPEKLEDSVGKDVKQKSLQFRSGQANGGLGLYHGKGEGKDDKKKEIVKYLKEVDQGIGELIKDNQAPLVVAAVESVFSLFQEVSNYKNIYPKPVAGNYDDKDILLVHEKACAVLEPWFQKERQENKEKFHSKADMVESDLSELFQAAISGSIETLFVEKDEFVWGKTDPELGKVQIHEQKQQLDTDLLDAVARQTFLKGGTVFREASERMPEQQSPVTAILRF